MLCLCYNLHKLVDKPDFVSCYKAWCPSLLYCPHNNPKPCQKTVCYAAIKNSPTPSCHNTSKLLQKQPCYATANPVQACIISAPCFHQICIWEVHLKGNDAAYPNCSNCYLFPSQNPSKTSSINRLFSQQTRGWFLEREYRVFEQKKK